MRDAVILIVDDEAANVRFLQDTLRPLGYSEVHGTTEPAEAESLFAETSPDLVMVDLMMPRLDGVQLLGRLKPLIEPGDFLPIVILSADASPEGVRRALSAGANDYLTKPLRVHEVRLRIANLLQTRGLHLKLRRHNRSLEARVRTRTAALVARTEELEDARAEILARLGRAAEYRDDSTGEHTERVGRLAALLAAELGLPQEECELIERVAPLHDVGKIGIPDHVLLKPSVLSREDFEQMKSHTLLGAELLGGSRHPILTRAAQVAMTHHEHWDGTGYPKGLKGDAIPLEGRIVAVADVFDSLTHARPYKPAWSSGDALVEIQKQSGRQFDPTVVAALVALCERGVLAPIVGGEDRMAVRLASSNGGTPDGNGASSPSRHNERDHIALLEQERARLARRVERLEAELRGQAATPEQTSAA
ncbi:MAG: HD domain-containing phosphohydrolase [Longimicrobiales bacterium]